MIENESLWFRIIIISLNLLSIIGCLIILWTFHKVPRLTQNPGLIVQRIQILQIIYSSNLLLSQFYVFPPNVYNRSNQSNQSLEDTFATFTIGHETCNGIGFIAVAVISLYNIYNVLLVGNLYVLINKTTTKFSTHFGKMEFVSLLTSLVIAGLTFYEKGYSVGYFNNLIIIKRILGDCNFNEFSDIQFIMSFIGLLVDVGIIIAIYKIGTDFDSSTVRQSVYSIDCIKFQKKYFAQFIRINLFYVIVFILTRLIPELLLILVCIFRLQHHFSKLTQMLLLSLVSLGGLLMLIIRANEPIVKKYIKQQFQLLQVSKLQLRLNAKSSQSDNPSNLEDPLIQSTHNDIKTLEITLYQEGTTKTIQTKTLKSGSEPLFQFSSEEKRNLPTLLIHSLGEFMQILITINYVMLEQHQEGVQDKIKGGSLLSCYEYIHINQKAISLNYSPKELERLLKQYYIKHKASVVDQRQYQQQQSDSNEESKEKETEQNKRNPDSSASSGLSMTLEDFIEQVRKEEQGAQTLPQHQTIECFSYCQIPFSLALKGFCIDQQIIKSSLEISNNLKSLSNINDISVFNRYGTVFVTQNGLFSIDLISRAHKTKLTRGGVFQRMQRRWIEAYNDAASDQPCGVLLPSIIGLFSIQLVNKRCINVLLRLNSLRFNYPLTQQIWESEIWIKTLTKNNVIGWVCIHPQQVNKRFLATSVVDGKFKITLNQCDFKLSEESQLNLIETLQRDLPILASISSNFLLNFVYIKFMKHEIQQEKYDISKAAHADCLIVAGKKGNKYVGQFALDSKIGYVKVFFDTLFTESPTLNEEDTIQLQESLIATVTDYI